MDVALRIVTQMPLAGLWRDGVFTTASRIRSLTAEDIANLLRVGRIHFVIADIGTPPHWIPFNDCYDFWKRELQPHLAAPASRAALDAFPSGYCYFASEWSGGDKPIVVCE